MTADHALAAASMISGHARCYRIPVGDQHLARTAARTNSNRQTSWRCARDLRQAAEASHGPRWSVHHARRPSTRQLPVRHRGDAGLVLSADRDSTAANCTRSSKHAMAQRAHSSMCSSRGSVACPPTVTHSHAHERTLTARLSAAAAEPPSEPVRHSCRRRCAAPRTPRLRQTVRHQHPPHQAAGRTPHPSCRPFERVPPLPPRLQTLAPGGAGTAEAFIKAVERISSSRAGAHGPPTGIRLRPRIEERQPYWI
eukprot:SAG31_NODE_8469_length_1446_cov_0.932442_1_plen_254_part_00